MPTPPKTHRAKRGRVLRWVCTVLTVVLLVPWTASFWYGGGRIQQLSDGSASSVEFFHGLVDIHRFRYQGQVPITANPSTDWRLNRIPPQWPRWMWFNETRTTPGFGTSTDTFIPLTPLLAVMLAATGWLWWKEVRSRRRQAWQCAACGYDRRGLASSASPCPECGAAPTPAPVAEVRG